MRAAVNKLISIFNDGNYVYVRELSPALLRTFFPAEGGYEEDADVLEALLHVFQQCDMPQERAFVERVLHVLPAAYVMPSGDTHFTPFLHNGRYQEEARQTAYRYIEKWGMALDIGGHVGFWANDLAKHFETVHSFEPNPDTFKCLIQNKAGNVTAHEVGLGNVDEVKFLTHPDGIGCMEPINSGGWEIDGNEGIGTYQIDVRRLDSFSFEPDFIKIDVQGYELNVLQGAQETISRYRPVILVELVSNGVINEPAIGFIEGELGMVRKDSIRNDYIYGW